MRLAGAGAGEGAGREVVLDGLRGGTRVEEMLRQGVAALGLPEGGELVAMCEGMLLRQDATLEEAGVQAGGLVEAWVRTSGGMRAEEEVGIFALGERKQEEGEDDIEVLEGAVEKELGGLESVLRRFEAVQRNFQEREVTRAIRFAHAICGGTLFVRCFLSREGRAVSCIRFDVSIYLMDAAE